MAKANTDFGNPTMDIGDEIAELVGDTGGVQEALGGYRIKVYHTGAFPWAEVFKVLLFRGWKVYVTHHKADFYIEAQP
jgi:hypothetical protein